MKYIELFSFMEMPPYSNILYSSENRKKYAAVYSNYSTIYCI